jgi:hypothetical protein
MPIVVPFPPSSIDPTANPPDARVGKVVDAIKLLLDTLTLDEQRGVLKALNQHVQPIDTPRAGELLGKIVRWIPRDSAWTVDDAKREVAAQGIEASPKEIYNAIAYLSRKGHVRRIGYGRYIVDGIGVTTSDDLGGEPARYEDD